MSLFERRVGEIQALALSGLQTGSTLRGIFAAALVELMKAAADHLENAGAEKKQLVLAALGQLVDRVPLPLWAAPFRPLLRRGVLWVADRAIEALYLQFKERFAV